MAKTKETICNNCNSKSYCANKALGVTDCVNYNKFPKPSADEFKR